MSAMKTTPSSHSGTISSNLTLFKHVRYEHLIAGVTGGVTSTLLLHPLDLLKIRFAVSDGRQRNSVPQYNSLFGAVSAICRQEGVKGLYKGVTPNMWGSGSAWGLYFLFYNAIKNWIQGGNTKTPLGPTMHMTAAAEAGILTLIMTNPVWVIKTRLCLQYAGDNCLEKTYTGMLDALRKIYAAEGVRGLYRGFLPGMVGVSHGALQFMTYEEMKTFYNEYRHAPIDSKLTTMEYISFAAASKLVAAVITYPYQVVRARLQDQHLKYDGALDCVKQTWRYEGWFGYYKGLSVNLIRVVPGTAITIITYEKVSQYLIKRTADKAVSPANAVND